MNSANLLALRPVVCVIDALHRDLNVADDARRGLFTHAGVTLDLGLRPDWLHDGLAADEEWRIEWVKLYEGLDLGHAYAATGNVAHLDAWQDLVDSFLDQVPVGHDTSDVNARRMQNWIYAWQRFAAAKGFAGLRPGLLGRIVERLAADADYLADHLTAERNHRTLELYALLVVGMALGDSVRTAAALRLLAENATVDIGDDGVQRERSSDYHMIVLRSLIGAIANCRAGGLATPPLLVHQVHLACTFGLHLQRPDGTTPALSDGDQADFRAMLLDAADLLDRPDLRWAATGGREGEPPHDRHASFPSGGYVTQRSGWGDGTRAYVDERWAVLDCGPLGDGGHGHYDHLSVELAAGGHRLVVDPGRYTYADGPWREWFKGTAAHNTVTVDGLDQQPYRSGRPKGPQSTATLIARHNVNVPCQSTDVPFDLVIARATSPRYDAVHTRTLALLDEDYWVVHDHLDAPTEHDYVLRWHLDVDAEDATELTVAAGCAIVRAPGGTIAMALLDGTDATVETGWVSPTYGVRHPAPVVALTSPRAFRGAFVTVVVPGDRRPVAVTLDTAGPRTGVSVHWDNHIDAITWTERRARAERLPC
ncbi:MAG: heparinase II/III family protein [Acidimicrobiales bacterium]